MSGRAIIYAIAGIVGVISFFFILKHFGAGNSLGDIFTIPFTTPITTTYFIDLTATFVLILVWLFREKNTVSGGAFLLSVVVTCFIAISAGFALFLIFQERQRQHSYGSRRL